MIAGARSANCRQKIEYSKEFILPVRRLSRRKLIFLMPPDIGIETNLLIIA
jgi:hypothetical protein